MNCPECGGPSSKGVKLRPFCSTGHKRRAAKAFVARQEQSLIGLSAKVGEAVREANGIVHTVKVIGTHAVTEGYLTYWEMVCDVTIHDYPKATTEAVNCFLCVAQEGSAVIIFGETHLAPTLPGFCGTRKKSITLTIDPSKVTCPKCKGAA